MTNFRNFTAPNIGLLYYKQLYKEILIEHPNILSFKEEGSEKLAFDVNDKDSEFIPFYDDLYAKTLSSFTQTSAVNLGNERFELYTTYPGLLVGSGYAHNNKAIGDAAVGFYFDYTSGLPVIPGSSIKGVLRSLFEQDIENDKQVTGAKSCRAIKFIASKAIEKVEDDDIKVELARLTELEPKDLEDMKSKIFGTNDEDGADIFFDAVMKIDAGMNAKFLGSDFITAHHPHLLENPNPVQFLKVLPNQVFIFRFYLTNAGISTEAKKAIFKQILLTIGAGAKTNVGYGQFSTQPFNDNTRVYNANAQNRHDNTQRQRQQDVRPNYRELAEQNRIQREMQQRQQMKTPDISISDDFPAEATFSRGADVGATIIKVEQQSLLLVLHVKEKSRLTSPLPDKYADYKVGQRLSLTVSAFVNNQIRGVKKKK